MTEQRPIQPTPVGALRFNTDSAKLEYFDGNQYVNITTDSPEQNTGGTRALFAGGEAPSRVNTITFANIDTTGNAVDFGDASRTLSGHTAFASRTRGTYKQWSHRPSTNKSYKCHRVCNDCITR